MEPRYIVKVRTDLQATKELARVSGRPHRILSAVMAVLCLAAGLCDNGTFELLYYVLAAWFAVMVVLWIVVPPRRMLKNLNRAVGEVTLTFTDEGIESASAVSSGQSTYAAFVRLVETKTHYLLFIQKKMAMILPKSGFTLGDPNTFIAYLEQKTGLKAQRR